MSMANRLRTLREQRGITREELAVALRVSPNTIYTWERGMVTPSLEYAALLAEFFGVSIDFLAGRSA